MDDVHGKDTTDQIIPETEEFMETTELDITVETVEEHVQTYEPVAYKYPVLFSTKTLIELSSTTWCRTARAREDVQPYLRGCKWSPDGTCCLSVVNNDGVHVTELPRDLYEGNVKTDRIINVLDSVIHVKESGLVYDFCWYPVMNSSIPESCCWLTTIQNAPIQLWDAFDGSLRCSYRAFNAVDEAEAAISITFSYDGAQIIAGYRNCIRTFDMSRPGRDCTIHKMKSPSSCLATSYKLLASGSWNTVISLYNTEEGTYKSVGKMHGHSGGITHMKFSSDGKILVTGARKDHRLLVWDLRSYRRPLNILSRAVDNNQRVYFDISPCGNYLVSGGTDGHVKVWDKSKIDWINKLCVLDDRSDNATYTFPLHKDSCNSISIHPYRPIIATGSGQYHVKDVIEDSSELIDLNGLNVNDVIELGKRIDYKYSQETENSLVFWWTGDTSDLSL